MKNLTKKIISFTSAGLIMASGFLPNASAESNKEISDKKNSIYSGIGYSSFNNDYVREAYRVGLRLNAGAGRKFNDNFKIDGIFSYISADRKEKILGEGRVDDGSLDIIQFGVLLKILKQSGNLNAKKKNSENPIFYLGGGPIFVSARERVVYEEDGASESNRDKRTVINTSTNGGVILLQEELI